MLFKKWSKMIFSSCSSLIPFDKKRFILSIILIKIQQNKEKMYKIYAIIVYFQPTNFFLNTGYKTFA